MQFGPFFFLILFLRFLLDGFLGACVFLSMPGIGFSLFLFPLVGRYPFWLFPIRCIACVLLLSVWLVFLVYLAVLLFCFSRCSCTLSASVERRRSSLLPPSAFCSVVFAADAICVYLSALVLFCSLGLSLLYLHLPVVFVSASGLSALHLPPLAPFFYCFRVYSCAWFLFLFCFCYFPTCRSGAVSFAPGVFVLFPYRFSASLFALAVSLSGRYVLVAHGPLCLLF